MHKFTKPENWNLLPLYKKVEIYGSTLTENYSKYVDKIEVKKYIENVNNIFKINIKVATVIKILKDIDDIDEKDINDNYIIKSSHASGWNIDTKYIKNINIIKLYLNFWNKTYKVDNLNEPQYQFIKPRFFIEHKIHDKYSKDINGNALVYMVRCLNGKPFSIRVKDYMNKSSSYDTDWNIIDINELNIDKPKNLNMLLKYASILSIPFEFVRVDFYIDKNDDVYLSEYTFTPSGGLKVFSDNIENEYGKLWN